MFAVDFPCIAMQAVKNTVKETAKESKWYTRKYLFKYKSNRGIEGKKT